MCVVVQQIEKEFKVVTYKNTPSDSHINQHGMSFTIDHLEKFNWTDLVEELQDKMLVTYHVLEMCSKKEEPWEGKETKGC